MSEELIDRKQVQEMFSLTTKQFSRVMRNIERRHPLEFWIKRIKENSKIYDEFIVKETQLKL